ncbi:cobalamin adenosyltransferase [Hathewaya histolytica]|uniref:ATP:Cob(I)alamin adenosyltransferase n=1 Tax=Hathewaya histolytica TaxID=1498 RepID=A0A4U9RIH7_HATHI|nr:cobalamin adenosyltransferase [Hathewaya histolytica]VTQ91619.1 ATP:Cob(I)alamin adenosyltransferase [Hathewaya histolytica]
MRKFITESYLRDLYRKKPFDTYKLEQEQRLTPGAAQYLSDKKIKINSDISDTLKTNKKASEKKQLEEIEEMRNNDLNLNKRLCLKLKSIEAAFLVTSSEILKEDIILAQNIISLNRKIYNIRNVISGKASLESICCKDCTGMNSSNFTTELDDCFEITEFHMQLEKSKSILKMHALRCELRELQFEIIDTYKSDDESLKNRIERNVNSIINSLSQLICLAVGGKECQRKV